MKMANCECHILKLFLRPKELCACMKKYLDSFNSTWKMFLDSYLLIKCNYDVPFLPKTFPKFYNECLSKWADYQNSPVFILPDVVRQISWNNMCINGRPMFRKNFRDTPTNSAIINTKQNPAGDHRSLTFESSDNLSCSLIARYSAH